MVTQHFSGTEEESLLFANRENIKIFKLETNTKGAIERTFRLTILHFQLESLFLRGHGGFKIHENNNNKKIKPHLFCRLHFI